MDFIDLKKQQEIIKDDLKVNLNKVLAFILFLQWVLIFLLLKIYADLSGLEWDI